MIRLAITHDGALRIGRAIKGTIVLQDAICPFTPHGDESRCATWCPHFTEPKLDALNDGEVLVQLCHGTIHSVPESEFEDQRETGEKS